MDTAHPLDAESRSSLPTPAASLICTPDQRVRVFISSTLDELAPERGAAREAITQLRLAPVFFESGARPLPATLTVPDDILRSFSSTTGGEQ